MDKHIFVAMVIRMSRIFTSVICMMLYTLSYAQWNNSFFDIQRPDTTEGMLTLHVDGLGYFRNSEYKSKIDEGRTLFGYQVWPELTYQAAPNLQVSLGLFSQQDFGADSVYRRQPTFSFQFQNNGHLIRFGTLNGSMQHQLIEPLYDPERIIENRLENGFQYVLTKRKIDGEFWIDWRRMIYQNSPFREEFTTGVRVEPKLPFSSKPRIISFPVSLLSFHKGGEIDTSKLPTISNFNFDYGVRYRSKKLGSLDSIDFQAHAIYYEDISTNTVNYKDGLGQYVSAAFYGKGFGLMLNYYDAHQFYNPMGDVVFRSVSARNSSYIYDYRKLAMVRASWQKEITTDFHFLIRANYIRDLRQNTNDIIAEFYFRWKPQFTLHKNLK